MREARLDRFAKKMVRMRYRVGELVVVGGRLAILEERFGVRSEGVLDSREFLEGVRIVNRRGPAF